MLFASSLIYVNFYVWQIKSVICEKSAHALIILRPELYFLTASWQVYRLETWEQEFTLHLMSHIFPYMRKITLFIFHESFNNFIRGTSSSKPLHHRDADTVWKMIINPIDCFKTWENTNRQKNSRKRVHTWPPVSEYPGFPWASCLPLP